MTYKIPKSKSKSGKTFRILVRGDDMYDRPFTEIVEIKAKSEKEALTEAESQNGVYEAEIVGEKE